MLEPIIALSIVTFAWFYLFASYQDRTDLPSTIYKLLFLGLGIFSTFTLIWSSTHLSGTQTIQKYNATDMYTGKEVITTELGSDLKTVFGGYLDMIGTIQYLIFALISVFLIIEVARIYFFRKKQGSALT
jgi:hypothetical protein